MKTLLSFLAFLLIACPPLVFLYFTETTNNPGFKNLSDAVLIVTAAALTLILFPYLSIIVMSSCIHVNYDEAVYEQSDELEDCLADIKSLADQFKTYTFRYFFFKTLEAVIVFSLFFSAAWDGKIVVAVWIALAYLLILVCETVIYKSRKEAHNKLLLEEKK